MSLTLQSSAFEEGEAIPQKYTCDGLDVSPPLSWNGAPEGTQEWALIVDDPDAPAKVWVHWVLYNLDASAESLEADVPTTDSLQGGALQGKNDFDRWGYGGPCPPSGPPHRYRFTLYALDSKLDLRPGATKEELLNAMKGHILGESRLTGLYKRKR